MIPSARPYPVPPAAPATPGAQATGFQPPAALPAPTSMSNGILTVVSAKQMTENARQKAMVAAAKPHIQGLASYVRRCWSAAKNAKQDVETRMFRNLRARSGQYDPEVLAEIRKQGGSEIYMMLTATKCRGFTALIRDILVGAGAGKPWALSRTPVVDLPPEKMAEAKEEAVEAVMQVLTQGYQPSPAEMRQMAEEIKDRYLNEVNEEAEETIQRAEDKMEDQHVQGGFTKALSEFIDDLGVFPSAILKGPVLRKKHVLKYTGKPGLAALEVSEQITPEWERVDPFRCYPAPHATNVQDGYFIEHHSLTKESLLSLIGVDGYDENAIRTVLDEYGTGGLKEWLRTDSQLADIEERSQSSALEDPERLIDALQFWGAVEGKMLREFGMDESEVKDDAKMYWAEVWLVGSYVIKAVLNTHPLGHRPYYMTSAEKIPGRFWGNSPADAIWDCQSMCNAAARALSNNMGIGSGPQVWIDTSRLPAGEDITQMYPWKIWQTERDMTGGSGAPMGFFQPETHATELMGVYEKFALLADEYSGVPRYMTGAEGTPGAGRTASGLSMMITNAGKTVKQVVSNVDVDVIVPGLTDQYHYNLRYSEDPDLHGDLHVVARGATSMQVKDTAALRRNEFLQATANPTDMQILGLAGRAEVLREVAKTLDMNTDKVVPPPAAIKRNAIAAQQQAMMAQQAQGQQSPAPSKEVLADGTPTTDNFSPS